MSTTVEDTRAAWDEVAPGWRADEIHLGPALLGLGDEQQDSRQFHARRAESDAGADQRDQAGRGELIRERACKDSAAVLISLINVGIGMK